jgi:predicted cupin superfamily sugar epimerase
MSLMTETNTVKMERRVLRAARAKFGRKRFQANFEHGQWWLTILGTGAQYSVVDCQTQAGVDYLDFEQVTAGDE